MNCEVQHLAENIRYRILIIYGEQYILDMERFFWKIIFPFLFCTLPSPIFKVENQGIEEKLKVTKKEKVSSGQVIMWGVIAVVLGKFFTPLVVKLLQLYHNIIIRRKLVVDIKYDDLELMELFNTEDGNILYRRSNENFKLTMFLYTYEQRINLFLQYKEMDRVSIELKGVSNLSEFHNSKPLCPKLFET